ncbi:hypothetical protein Pmani_025945 [Petrolisthes manimaculis]|uniref:Uncharacterized protein n=1 Tax=Petrolisthes manimaculis TaxID=1843537 RepID=A0AAE1P680_9EUCA|nr:hypothetical protein Pmani_025945 [Petrolisthes manimaculis]
MRRSSGSGDSASRLSKPPLVKKNSGSQVGSSPPPRYLWIRVALIQKLLAKIIDYLVQNNSIYWEYALNVRVEEIVYVHCHQQDWKEGVTEGVWASLHTDGCLTQHTQLLARVYLGGVTHQIRREVWPYLLNHYQFGSTPEERNEQDRRCFVLAAACVSAVVGPPPPSTTITTTTTTNTTSTSTTTTTTTTTPVIISKASLDSGSHSDVVNGTEDLETTAAMDSEVKHITENGATGPLENGDNNNTATMDCNAMDTLGVEEGQDGHSLESRSSCISPASSQGGVYSTELLDTFGLNLHRIDKDVQRCDRNYWYFTQDNLEKLRNVMCTSLIQILDSEMFELMHQNGDYTHFYFCYRWFLLDFKREMAERHDALEVLQTARNLVLQLQTLIENK